MVTNRRLETNLDSNQILTVLLGLFILLIMNGKEDRFAIQLHQLAIRKRNDLKLFQLSHRGLIRLDFVDTSEDTRQPFGEKGQLLGIWRI